jgi:hypothetical protein
MVASRLAEIDQASDTVESVKAQARAEVNLFQKNSSALNTWRLNNPHLANDDELFARMTEIDSELAKKTNLPFEERLQKAADRAARELGDPEERDNAGAIEQMRRGRASYKADPSKRAELTATDESGSGSDYHEVPDTADAEIELHRSVSIALMAQERKPKALSEDYIARRRAYDEHNRNR